MLSISCRPEDLCGRHTVEEAQKRITTFEWTIYLILMLTIEQCTKILNQNGNVRYTKEEIKAIREFLYAMAQLQCETKIN